MQKSALPKINFRTARTVVFLVILLTATFSSGYFIGNKGYNAEISKAGSVEISRGVPPQHEDLDFNLFWKVWDSIEADYVDKSKINQRDMVYGAIQGMVSAVGDPYTVFLPPSENKVFQEDISGNFDGVGIQIGYKGSRLAVIAPLPETPADKAGIKAGDLIVGIIDEGKGIDRSTDGLTLPEAVQAIRGPKGTSIKLVLLREGRDEPLEVEVKRDSIDVPSVMYTSLEGDSLPEGVRSDAKVAHIRLLKFGGETNNEWDDSVREVLKNQDLDGVILDLRNNPGGYLQAAVEIASDFVESGSVVVIEEGSNGRRSEFKSQGIPRLTNSKVVILVNEGSASASEILAGSLRDLSKMPIVGTTTFGKGTIQEPRQMDGGSSLHLTTSKWLTPSGYWVHDTGLEPDIIVEDDLETEQDEQLTRAIMELVS